MAVSSRSRGRFAVAAALFIGVLGATSFVEAQAVSAPVALSAPGSALAQAVRGRMSRGFAAPPPGKFIFPVDAAPDCSLWRNSFGRPGSTSSSGVHEGTDIMGSAGRAIYSMTDGVLTRRYTGTGIGSGYGWTVTVAGTTTQIKYFHMAPGDAGWTVGDQVHTGDVLGYVGDTGTTAGNFHLHLEVRPNNIPVDPLPLLDIPTQCHVY